MTACTLKKLLMVASLCLPAAVLAQEQNSVAKLTDAGGTVMVDHGKGFVTTNVGAPLLEKDRVITLDGSMAEITYTDGCCTKLKSNNLIVISIDPGCKAAILDATQATLLVPQLLPFTQLPLFRPSLAWSLGLRSSI